MMIMCRSQTFLILFYDCIRTLPPLVLPTAVTYPPPPPPPPPKIAFVVARMVVEVVREDREQMVEYEPQDQTKAFGVAIDLQSCWSLLLVFASLSLECTLKYEFKNEI